MKELLKNTASFSVMPILLGLWLYTGIEGFYNIYAGLVVVAFIFMVIAAGVIGAALWLDIGNEQKIFEEAGKKLREQNRYMRWLSYATSVVVIIGLFWFGKFIIATIATITLMLSVLMLLFALAND